MEINMTNPLISLCIDHYRQGLAVLAVTYYPQEHQIKITYRRIYRPSKAIPHDDYKIHIINCAQDHIEEMHITVDQFVECAKFGKATDWSIKKNIWLTKPQLWR